MRTLRIPLLAAALTAALWAQTTEKPLTNRDIESMLAAGLPESTIVIRIEMAAHRGVVDLDASSDALAALKQKGATERELNAVLWAEPFGAGWKLRQEENRAVPDLPGPAGVYFRAPAGWTRIGSFLLWTPFYSGWNWYHGRRESTVALGSAQAALQMRETQPTFYLREPASGEPWRIIRVSSRDAHRLLRVAASDDLGQPLRTQPNQVSGLQMTHVAGRIFTLKPAGSLEPGEYVLCTTVPGGPGLNLCYSFGVHP
ncbi:MAG TPA: hypothetical protein VKT49_11660 [Bryobacteraceae bacterium]|nr:hypothetical protein [Bryobacteraceae bacterium]